MPIVLPFFDSLLNPRVERTRLHSLKDILAHTICAVLSGCNDWEEIELYGISKEKWLKTFLVLPVITTAMANLTPSFSIENTIERGFSL